MGGVQLREALTFPVHSEKVRKGIVGSSTDPILNSRIKSKQDSPGDPQGDPRGGSPGGSPTQTLELLVFLKISLLFPHPQKNREASLEFLKVSLLFKDHTNKESF